MYCPQNLDKKFILWGQEHSIVLFEKSIFIFKEKWHNNSIDKKRKAVLNCLFLFLKKEVTDAQEQSFNNIKESKATVKIHR